jgi:hypothetical protein
MRGQRSGLVVQISSPQESPGRSSSRLTQRPSSPSKAGSSRFPRRWRRSVFARCLWSQASSAPSWLTEESTNYPEPSIDDYAEKTQQTVTAWKGMNGLQGGDPAKLAKALVQLASQDKTPLRWAAGADAVATFERKANELLAQANAYRDLSSSLTFDDVGNASSGS